MLDAQQLQLKEQHRLIEQLQYLQRQQLLLAQAQQVTAGGAASHPTKLQSHLAQLQCDLLPGAVPDGTGDTSSRIPDTDRYMMLCIGDIVPNFDDVLMFRIVFKVYDVLFHY